MDTAGDTAPTQFVMTMDFGVIWLLICHLKHC